MTESYSLGDLATADLSLKDDEVQTWFASLELSSPSIDWMTGCLSGDEKERAARFHFERDRTRFVGGRGLLRTLLAGYLHVRPERLEFSYGVHGKPELTAYFGERPLRFNLSHSERFVLYAITRGREIGVDLEVIRPVADLDKIAEHFFSAGEREALRSLPDNEKTRAFFDCWTRKEAYLKALGNGLAKPLNSFDVSLTPGEPARLLDIEGDPFEPKLWELHALSVMDGTVGALAVRGTGCAVASLTLSDDGLR
jgi:4'-phosphopantetheinyl transferase